MTSSSYPYIKLRNNALVPLIEVRLGNPTTHKVLPKNIFALIDSGADVCFCSENIAAYLGAMVTKSKKKEYREFYTANNGKFKAYKVKLTLYACGKSFDCPFFITPDLPPHVPLILGQNGFFNKFKIEFDFKNKVIKISS